MTARTIAASAAREAERILAAYHPGGTLPVPIETLVERLGIRQGRKQQNSTTAVGFTIRNSLGDITLGVNTAHGRARQRFALAHALGHALMDERDLILCHAVRAASGLPAGSTATMAQERAANRFAAELLMPENAVMREVDTWVGDKSAGTDRERLVNDLHKLFGVTVEAMAHRLVDLAVIVP